MTRCTLTEKDKIEIAERRHWRAPGGGVLCLEAGKVRLLATGEVTEVDHAWQIATGGPDTKDNLRHMSREDHAEKSKRDGEARRMIRRVTGKNKPKRKYNWPKGRGFGIPGLRKKLDGTVVKI